jgi:hypothetical protein
MRQTSCRITAIFFRPGGTFFRLLHILAPATGGKARNSGALEVFPKKMRLALKAFSAAPLSPFEAASSLMAAT